MQLFSIVNDLISRAATKMFLFPLFCSGSGSHCCCVSRLPLPWLLPMVDCYFCHDLVLLQLLLLFAVWLCLVLYLWQKMGNMQEDMWRGKEVFATESADICPKLQCPFPRTHQTERIHQIIDIQTKQTQEQQCWVND